MANKYTSLTLRCIAYFWMSLPITYLLFAGFGFSLGISGVIKLILSPWYWVVCFFMGLSGFGLLNLKWYGWSSFIASNLMLTYQSTVAITYYSTRGFKLGPFIISILVQLIFLLIIGKQTRIPYFFPKIRWWESDPRYKLSVQVDMIRGNETIGGEIMDISLGGCFIKTHSFFSLDESIDLSFEVFEKKILCKGIVVWRTESTVTHPKGIGVKFDGIPKESLVVLKKATQKLQELARVYNHMNREKNWQEYIQREQTFQGKTEKK